MFMVFPDQWDTIHALKTGTPAKKKNSGTAKKAIMRSRKLKVFVRPGCPKCPAAKRLAEDLKNKVDVTIYDTETREGLAEASYYQVMSTPTFVAVDERDEEFKFWPDIPKKEEILRELQ